MARTSTRGVLLSVVGVLVAVGIVLGVLFLVNAEYGFQGCTGTTRFGWIAPLLAASIIGGLAWVLLGQEPHIEEKDTPEAAVCPSCQKDVLGQWRLCPYCGAMLDSEPHLDSDDH